MKRLSWPGVAVVAGSTLLSWLAGSPGTSPSKRANARVEPSGQPARTAPAESAGHDAEAAAIESMQLHDWRERLSGHAERERNIFSFKRSAKPVPPPVPERSLLAAGAGAERPALVLFKLIGVAEDPAADGPIRTAIISGQGQLYLAKEGDTVAFIYRVGRVSSESVELIDTAGGAPLELTLK
jgi:hypothetical protein